MASVPSHIIWPTRLTAADRCRWPVLIVPSKETDPQLNPWRASLAGAKWPFPSVSIQTVYDTNPSREFSHWWTSVREKSTGFCTVTEIDVSFLRSPWQRRYRVRCHGDRRNETSISEWISLWNWHFHYSVHSSTATRNRPAITLSVVVK